MGKLAFEFEVILGYSPWWFGCFFFLLTGTSNVLMLNKIVFEPSFSYGNERGFFLLALKTSRRNEYFHKKMTRDPLRTLLLSFPEQPQKASKPNCSVT